MEEPMNLINNMCLAITFLKSLTHIPGVHELTEQPMAFQLYSAAYDNIIN